MVEGAEKYVNIRREGDEIIIEVDCFRFPYGQSIEDSDVAMSLVINQMQQVRGVTRVMFRERRIFEYSSEQVHFLQQIADVIRYIRNSPDLFSAQAFIVPTCSRHVGERFGFVQNLVTSLIPRDPLDAYVEVDRVLRHEQAILETDVASHKPCTEKYIEVLTKIKELLDKTDIIKTLKSQIGKAPGRSAYAIIFRPMMRPNFTFTRLMAEYPKGAELLYDYKVGDSVVSIFRPLNSVRLMYHIIPPEFKLTEEQLMILDEARQVMVQHKPRADELLDPERVRDVFFDIASDIIAEHAARYNMNLKAKENDMLSNVLVRETAGFGILEVILQDDRVQDISVNAPPGVSPIYVYHADAEDCETNVLPTREELESWAARLRLMSGRPLDQANPVLDTSLIVPGARARVAAITQSLSPYGLAFSFRRHRDKPWTLPLFIKEGMISPIAAGVLSFLADGARTILIAGTRGAGKSSLLAAMMVEVMRRYRMITVEDTLELPVQEFAKLGYNILSMKVKAAIVQTESELSAASGIRTSLRLGDSCLIVGEVRSEEALALYEAMRVGALANMVAGTIHGESPYGVFDRVVHDLGVPPTSFKATDVIVVANPIKSADGLHKRRRVIQITEVRKGWTEDPLLEHGFMDLLVYNPKTDQLEPTRELIEGESEVLSAIAGRVKEWIGNFDAVWSNIKLRAKIKQSLVEFADKLGRPDLLEARFVVNSNDMFHILSEQVRQERGELVSDEIYQRWESWLRSQLK